MYAVNFINKFNSNSIQYYSMKDLYRTHNSDRSDVSNIQTSSYDQFPSLTWVTSLPAEENVPSLNQMVVALGCNVHKMTPSVEYWNSKADDQNKAFSAND